MPQVSTTSSAPLPRSYESSGLRTYRDSDDLSRLWEKVNQLSQQIKEERNAAFRLGQQFRFTRRRILGGQGGPTGIIFQSPLELDPTVDVSANTLVYISPLNPIVTTGIQDSTPGGPQAGSIVKAPSGLWCAIQDVPAQVTGSPDTYYVPQLPYPNSPNAPSGTPLTGDLDNPSVFWVLISQAPVCTA